MPSLLGGVWLLCLRVVLWLLRGVWLLCLCVVLGVWLLRSLIFFLLLLASRLPQFSEVFGFHSLSLLLCHLDFSFMLLLIRCTCAAAGGLCFALSLPLII